MHCKSYKSLFKHKCNKVVVSCASIRYFLVLSKNVSDMDHKLLEYEFSSCKIEISDHDILVQRLD